MDDDVNDNFVRCLKLSTLLLALLLLLLLLEKEEATWIGSNLLRSTSEQITEDRTQIEGTIMDNACRLVKKKSELILYSSTTINLNRLIDRPLRKKADYDSSPVFGLKSLFTNLRLKTKKDYPDACLTA